MKLSRQELKNIIEYRAIELADCSEKDEAENLKILNKAIKSYEKNYGVDA